MLSRLGSIGAAIAIVVTALATMIAVGVSRAQGPAAPAPSSTVTPFDPIAAAPGKLYSFGRTPVLKPDQNALLREGLAAAAAQDWLRVDATQSRLTDRLARSILDWRYAVDQSSPAGFDTLSRALDTFKDWPGRSTIRRRAETGIFDSTLSMPQRIVWLRREEGPVTGDGWVALAQAQRATGDRAGAAFSIKRAWRDYRLTPRAERIALDQFADVLSGEDHFVRADLLLWADDRGGASRLLPYLSGMDRAIVNARVTLQARPRRGVQAAVDAVTGARRSDPGFMYDRARYTRRSGRPEAALPVAAAIDPMAARESVRDEIFDERRLYVPRALRDGDASTAYRLVSNHGVPSGAEFADGEWLAGWIALRFLKDPTRADAHFAALNANVSTPVSKSRALYWRGQSLQALGRTQEANAALAEAAALNFTYYGLLAAEQLDPRATLAIQQLPPAPPAQRAEFESREVVRVLLALAEAGEQRDFESVAFHLDDTLQTPEEHEMLAALAKERAYMRTAVRSAKAGIRRGILPLDAAFPVVPLPPGATKPGRPEPAFTHAIIRQESEFDPLAVSSANARGLMQLLPSTARAVAQREGLGYDTALLTADPNYNITLGSAYLEHLMEEWNGSYLLTIASYNAGPGNVRRWIADWGDPRGSGVDVVDWVELIPFSETRNYVQRVMENVHVYRHRLAGQPTPITLSRDLRRGS